jgi:hypothetical protein
MSIASPAGDVTGKKLRAALLRWLRQSGAFVCLVALLALPVGFYTPASGGFEGSGISVVKPKPSSPIEGVDILNSAPYEDALCPGLNSIEIVGAYGDQSCDAGHSARADERPRGWFVTLLHAESRIFSVKYPHGGPRNRLAGRCLTEIFDLYLRSDSAHSVHKLDISMLDGDVGPQLPLRGSPHYPKCEKQCPELKERDETCDTSDFVTKTPPLKVIKTPSLKPLLNSLVVVPLGFFLCLFGGGLFDDGRRLSGGLTFVFRLLLGGLGILPWGFL